MHLLLIRRVVIEIRHRVRGFYDKDKPVQVIPFLFKRLYTLFRFETRYLKGGAVAKTVQELQGEYDKLVGQREKLLPEIASVSEDLAKTQKVVLSEVDAFARASALSMRLTKLKKERDTLSQQIEQIKFQPQS